VQRILKDSFDLLWEHSVLDMFSLSLYIIYICKHICIHVHNTVYIYTCISVMLHIILLRLKMEDQ
jgi:hypothetical protein